MPLYTGLCHYPVYDKNKNVICAQITPIDLHDMARLSVTFGVEACYIINPLKDQLEIAQRIIEHWILGFGASYNPHRKLAMERLRLCHSLEDAMEEIRLKQGFTPLLIATDASQKGRLLSYAKVRAMLKDQHVLLIFGTAWGLQNGLIDKCYGLLEPIWGVREYNHLSVRTAAAIILDRLVGRYKKEE